MKTTTQQIAGLTLTMITAPVQLDMAKRALAFPEDFAWTKQGLGMVRTKLTRSLHLHIWHPSFVTEEASRIHSHPWDFTSLILAGKLTDITYLVGNNPSPLMTSHRIMCGADCHVTETTATHAGVLTVQPYTKGQAYAMIKGNFHQTMIGSTGCISIINRNMNSWEDDYAEVLTDYGKPFVSAAPVDLSVSQIKEVLALPHVVNLRKEMEQ